jgi:hypothetical protein
MKSSVGRRVKVLPNPVKLRYQVTETGRKALAALLTALRTTVRQLLPEAA